MPAPRRGRSERRAGSAPPTNGKNVTERWWKEQGGEGGSGTSGEGGRERGRGRRGPDGQPRRGRKGVDEIGEGRGGEEGRDEARAPRKSADGEGRGWDGMGGREWIKAGREGSEWGGAGRDEWRGGIKPGAGDAVDGVGEWGGRGEERRGSGPNDACCEAEADDALDGGAEKVGREKDGGWSGWIKEIGNGSNGGDPRYSYSTSYQAHLIPVMLFRTLLNPHLIICDRQNAPLGSILQCSPLSP
ncbi:hypothetical protein C8J57DRAFT_1229365 [Mycena rebaudengoi]|nr:hypothetical protein C8J57DRAFT_1229365 [Mycena rebaudengoi]